MKLSLTPHTTGIDVFTMYPKIRQNQKRCRQTVYQVQHSAFNQYLGPTQLCRVSNQGVLVNTLPCVLDGYSGTKKLITGVRGQTVIKSLRSVSALHSANSGPRDGSKRPHICHLGITVCRVPYFPPANRISSVDEGVPANGLTRCRGSVTENGLLSVEGCVATILTGPMSF